MRLVLAQGQVELEVIVPGILRYSHAESQYIRAISIAYVICVQIQVQWVGTSRLAWGAFQHKLLISLMYHGLGQAETR